MIDFFEQFHLPFAKGLCYSGFRDGQEPGGATPTYEQVKEDLLLLKPHCSYLRLYDCDEHAATVLQVIEKEQLHFKVMLGAYLAAEKNNPNCPWGGGMYTKEQLQLNKTQNQMRANLLADWATQYANIIFSLSVGNEACVDWTDHMVPVETVVAYIKEVKIRVQQPVTFCENYVPWLKTLQPVAAIADCIAIHTYPVWEYKNISEALQYTIQNYESVVAAYPHQPVIITEAGWATASNGRGIEPSNAGEAFQKIYYEQLMEWSAKNKVLTFFFEAFDENWKGSSDPDEPEKHWGLFTTLRQPKLVLQNFR